MLELPDVRAAMNYSCGDAAQDCVFGFFGVRPATPALATDPDGLHPAVIEATFRKSGLFLQSGTMTVADLRHHTRLGRPVLCPIALFGGHWVVVSGVTTRYVYYACSTDGPQRRLHDSWNSVWRDTTRSGHAFNAWGIAVWASQSQR